MFEKWRQWFDSIWKQAAPLTSDTIKIPALVPATGTRVATEERQTYCDICTGRSNGHEMAENNSRDPDSIVAKITDLGKCHELESRITRLFKAGKQVIIARSNAILPLEVPVKPRLLHQEGMIRDGAAIQRQSFSVSVFSDSERKKINEFRGTSRAILEKLGNYIE